LKKDIERIREMVKELVKGNNRKMEDIEWGGRRREGSLESRLKKMERNMERREKEERRMNIERGVEGKEGKGREAVKEILKVVGVKVEIKEIRRKGGMKEKGGIWCWLN